MAEDDELLPKKKPATATKSSGRSSKGGAGVSPPMRRLMRIVRAIGVLLGGFVTLVGAMSVVGLVTDNFWARFIVAGLVVVGLPAFIADRFLKRTNLGRGLGLVADVVAIVLLGIAIGLVEAAALSRPLLVREGDRYARAGTRSMARAVYFLGGVSPVFPEEKRGADAGPGGSASAGPGGSAATSAGSGAPGAASASGAR